MRTAFASRCRYREKIVQAHPEAEQFEIWSQDEARVGQKAASRAFGPTPTRNAPMKKTGAVVKFVAAPDRRGTPRGGG